MSDTPSGVASRLFLAAAALALLFLGWSEFHRFADHRAAVGDTVDYDVPAARQDLISRLHQLERDTARIADAALDATRGLEDRADVFGALRELDLPAGTGLLVLDVQERPLAWLGATEDAAAEAIGGGDRTRTFTTPDTRQLAVVRTTTAAAATAPAIAVAHRPYHTDYRLLDATGLEVEVERRHRVGEVRVIHDLASTEGEPIPSVFGGSLARLSIAPISRQSWLERVERDAAGRRVAGVAALLLLGVAWIWFATRRGGSESWGVGVRAHAARAAAVVGARLALAWLPVHRLLPDEGVVDPDVYGGTLAPHPFSLVLTCATAFVVAVCVRRAVTTRDAPTTPRWSRLLLVLVVAVGARWGLEWLIDDVTSNSRAEFFPAATLFPAPGPALVLLSLLLAGGAVLTLVEAAWSRVAARPRARLVTLGVVLTAALLTPTGPGGVGLDALIPLGWTGFAVATTAAFARLATPARAALIPLALALGFFPALERSLLEELQEEALDRAADLGPTDDTVDRVRVAEALDRAAASEELALGLQRGRLPPDLARRLWSESSLPDTARGSGLFIEPHLGGPKAQSFEIDLASDAWREFPTESNEERWIRRLGGRGLGSGGVWIVGETPASLPGREVPAAVVRVVIELQPPVTARLRDLDLLVAPPNPALRAPLAVEVTRYDPDGRLTSQTLAGAPRGASLEPREVQRALVDGGDTWMTTESGGRTLRVYVRRIAAAEDEGPLVQAVAFDTGGHSALLLRVTKLSVLGALAALAALVLTLHRWARGTRLQLAGRLVLAFVIVSAGPIVVLTWATRRIVDLRRTAVDRRDLQEAVEVVASMVANDAAVPGWVVRRQEGETPEGEPLRPLAHALGHHASLFWDGELMTTSDPGLVDIGILPRRLPGDAYHEIALLGRPLHISREVVGGYAFDVGYAPFREGESMILAVPVLHRRTERDREMVEFFTTVLGFYLLSLVGAIAGGSWMAARLMRPLRELTGATRRVSAGDLSRPVPQVGPGEFSEVVDAFNGMMRDLAESREKLVQAEKEAAWREMARQVAHEVKNPLTPMRLAAEHLRRAHRDRSPRFTEILERSVDVIVRQTEALKRIATDFSAFARLPRQHREPVAVRRLVEEIAELYQGVPRLELETELGDADPRVQADPDELKRVLINLVGNAVEAIDGRPGRILCSLASADGWSVVEVADDGPGIPAEAQTRLFEPSFSTKTGGTGLGLAICKRAIEDLGGTIEIDSEPGKGTRVRVRLPETAEGRDGQTSRA